VFKAVRDMDDVLSQGGDREPSRWPRRLAVIAVLVVLAVVIAGHLPRGRAVPAHRPAAAATGPVQLAGLGSGAAGLLDQAHGISGPASPWIGKLRLPATGRQTTWFWTANGRLERTGGLPR